MPKEKELSRTQELRNVQEEIKKGLEKLTKKYLPKEKAKQQFSAQPAGQ
jgi:hypothetical protein